MITAKDVRAIDELIHDTIELGEEPTVVRIYDAEKKAVELPIVRGEWKTRQGFRAVFVEECPTCGTKARTHGSGGPKAAPCNRSLNRKLDPGIRCPIRGGYYVYVPEPKRGEP